MNKLSSSLALVVCLWSLYSLRSPAINQITAPWVDDNHVTINLSTLLEPLEKLSATHHLNFVAFTPIFEQGNRAFSLDLEADFPHFFAWYRDVLLKMPNLHWQHLQFKPYRGILSIHLEGRNEA